MIDNLQFLSTIFSPHLRADEAIGTCAFTEPPEDRHAWPIRQPLDPNITELLGVKSDRANTFFCIASVKAQVPLSRARNSLSRVFVIPLDDIGYGEGSKTRPEDVLLEPTYKIETSRDNFQYGYVLEVPMTDLARAAGLVKGVAKLADEGGSMAAKLMRLPCGINNKRKYDEVHEVSLREWHPERRFTEDALIDAFNIDPEWLASQRLMAPGEAGGEANDDLFDWLQSRGQVPDPRPAEGGWVTITCPWADGHSDGKSTAGYSPVGLGGAQYRDGRQFKCLHDHCKDRSWIHIAQLMFVQRFALGPKSIVYDVMKPGVAQNISDFRNWAAPYHYVATTEKGKKLHYMADDWLTARARVTVDREGFHPKAARLYTDLMTGERVFNTFTPMPYFQPTKQRDLIKPILDQLEYLFKEELPNALSYLAYTFHRPEVRLQFALLHISPYHGTGRGWLKQLIAQGVGTKYFQTPTLNDFMTGSFNEWIYQSLFCAFDEVRQKSVKFSVQDRLRELITERRMQVNRKYMPKINADIHANLMFLSNHLDALQIPDEDRRLWVVVNYDPPKDAAWYSVCYAAIENNEAMRQFYWFLQDYLDVPGFNPNGRAPVTRHLSQVRDAARSELEVDMTVLVGQLRRTGVRAIYKAHFYALCKQLSVPLPTELTSRAGGGSAKERAMFWGILGDMNVHRTHRMRPTTAATAAMPGVGDTTEILVLDLDLAGRGVSDKKAAAEETALNRFLSATLEATTDHQRNLM